MIYNKNLQMIDDSVLNTTTATIINSVFYFNKLIINNFHNFEKTLRESFLQPAYDWYYSGYFSPKNDPLFADIACHMLLPMATYWSLASLFTFVDVTGWPKFIYKYKQQPKKNKITAKILLKTASLILFNHLTVQPAMAILAHLVYQWHGRDNSSEVPPLSTTFLVHFLVFLALEEPISFYHHRILHLNRYLYRRFHRQHHRWVTPIALATIYVHPVEYVLNQLPILAGPLVMGSHRAVVSLWVVVGQVAMLLAHSGYRFPIDPWFKNFHEYHHFKPNKNFGNTGLFDFWYGTSGSFEDELKVNNKKGVKNCQNGDK